jgi:hypothetical protein
MALQSPPCPYKASVGIGTRAEYVGMSVKHRLLSALCLSTGHKHMVGGHTRDVVFQVVDGLL